MNDYVITRLHELRVEEVQKREHEYHYLAETRRTQAAKPVEKLRKLILRQPATK